MSVVEMNLPEFFNAADYFVDRHVREGRGNNVAVKCEDRQLTYADIQTAVNRAGNAFKSLGVRMEERVALLLLDTEIFPESFFGAIKIGAVPVCLNTMMRDHDYLYFMNDSRARVLIIDAEMLPAIEPVRSKFKFIESIIVVHGPAPAGMLSWNEVMAAQPAELETAPTMPDDVCFWLYSSGSTGNPKGVVHLQHDMVYSCMTFGKQVLGIREDDSCYSAARLFFAYGLGNGLYFPFGAGATAVYSPVRPTPASVYEAINRHRPTLFFGVPTLFGSMLQSPGEINGVRLCVSAGEALPADILTRWVERHGVQIQDGIGSTEIAHIYISNSPDSIKPGSTGKLVPGYEARIVDENFNDVKVGDVGTLLIKGDSIAAGYWNKHEKTKGTFLGDWINTDDQYMMDVEGYFYYIGRSNDMIKAGGIWVSPIEVENTLIGHPAVLEAAVVGAPDAENLIKPKAYIVLKSGFTGDAKLEKELKDYIKTKLAHYKFPRWIVFMDDLPKTPTGKIKRFELKNLG